MQEKLVQTELLCLLREQADLRPYPMSLQLLLKQLNLHYYSKFINLN